MHSAGSSAVMASTPKRRSASNLAYGFAQGQAAGGNLADAAPLPRHGLKNLGHLPQGRKVALGPHAAGVLVLHLVPARFKLPDAHQHALQDVHGLKAGHHDGHAILLRRSADIRPCR